MMGRKDTAALLELEAHRLHSVGAIAQTLITLITHFRCRKPPRARMIYWPLSTRVSSWGMVGAHLLGLCFCTHSIAHAAEESAGKCVLVLGAAGTADYGSEFKNWAQKWASAAAQGNWETVIIGDRPESETETDRQQLETCLQESAAETFRPLWLVYLGHGTFDRRTARLNLRGPDITADDLAGWLKPVNRPTAIILCCSGSGSLLPPLSHPDRVVIVATKSGAELNFSRFGEFLALALTAPESDLDKDGQVSLWEAYLAGSRRTTEFYETEGRLQTEHPLLDDNGDRQGTRADSFQGLVPVETAKGGQLDGRLAHQYHLVPSQEDNLPSQVRKRRDELELAVLALRDRKAELPEERYYQQLEALLVELARLNANAK